MLPAMRLMILRYPLARCGAVIDGSVVRDAGFDHAIDAISPLFALDRSKPRNLLALLLA